MQRYFVDIPFWKEKEVRIEEDAHHIIRVMRYNVGDSIICVHPEGKSATCQIEEINETENYVLAKIIEWTEENVELPISVTIVQSLAKGNKLDLIIQKGTELGANQFILFQSERSVVKWDKKKIKNRLRRYEKIAKEASEQSGRTVVPKIQFVEQVSTYLEAVKKLQSIKLIAYEEEAKGIQRATFASKLQEAKIKNYNEIIVAIGPEGGFSEAEVATFKDYTFSPVRLGKRILRTETASLYALASISYYFEEME